MRVLITNVYSYSNKGDAAIVLALVNEVKRVFEPKQITIQTADMSEDEGKYGADYTESNLLWILASSFRNDSKVKQVIYLLPNLCALFIFLIIAKLTHKKLYFLISDPLVKFIKTIDNADIVIACGGGYLRTSSGSLNSLYILFLTGLNFSVGYFLNKPVYLYSQSVGPVYGKLQQKVLQYFLNKASLIILREKISYDYIKDLKIKSKFLLSSDAAFLLKNYTKGSSASSLPETLTLNKNKINIGTTVRNWFNDPKDQDEYENTMAAFFDILIRKYSINIFYIPQVIAKQFDDDDRKSANRVRELMVYKTSFYIISDNLHPFQLIKLVGKMDYFVGTRMHSNIYALINGVPTLAIEYEYKTRGIMEDLDLEEFVFSINDLSSEALFDKFSTMMLNREDISTKINLNLKKTIENGMLAIEMIRDDYNKY
jgi:colanic acid/amylovoran biosynthesis protein